MIPRRLFEQVVNRRHRIEHRRVIVANDTLFAIEEIARVQFEARMAVRVHADQMNPVRRDRKRDFLQLTTVAAREQGQLAAFF